MNRVLIVGSGGREHALLKALLRSGRDITAFAYPGNPGMERDGCTLVRDAVEGWDGLARWVEANNVDLTVVGPEIPLVEGIVDTFAEKKLCVFGPTAAAARLEGSKAFSKDLMRRYGIPTAAYETFTDLDQAVGYVKKQGSPVVVKASGLAAGKGAIVCETQQEALDALGEMLDAKRFGDAGSTVVIEEKMSGEEASVFVLTDGEKYRVLPVSQDHKRIGDNDTGLNTGGMGAYAPAPLVDPALLKRVESEVVVPTLAAMRSEGCPYRGLLYCGIMVTPEGPKVVEFNCRFGDPETQAVLPLVRGDWYEVFRACAEGDVGAVDLQVAQGSCAAVVLASGGYPGSYQKGKAITGIDAAESVGNVDVYHAGTARAENGELLTSGGRVLAVSAWDRDLEKAIARAYEAAGRIDFEGKYCRTDIGARGLARLAGAGA
jgi:phosphoribosylamine--glycine ligase